MSTPATPLSILLIGCGEGTADLLRLLSKEPHVKLLGVADRFIDGNLQDTAKALGIPSAPMYRTLLLTITPDVIIDTTGDRRVRKDLDRYATHSEIISGAGMKFILEVLSSRVATMEAQAALQADHHELANLMVACTQTTTLSAAARHIVDAAIHRTHSHGASLITYDEPTGLLTFQARTGSEPNDPSPIPQWPLQPHDLANVVLNQTEPVHIPNIASSALPDRSLYLDDGIQALLAVQIRSERKPLGILTVYHHTPRTYDTHSQTFISLLGNTTGPLIDKYLLLDQIRHEAMTDGLTGLANHRYFTQRLEHEMALSVRYQHPLTLIICDIDHFKHYNDTHGHEQGNVVLKGVAQLLQTTCRKTDLVARYGGEEFVIVMPETSMDVAHRLAERIRLKIAHAPFPHKERQPTGALTLSLGLACHPRDGSTADTLIARADQALYHSKREGRNRSTRADTLTP